MATLKQKRAVTKLLENRGNLGKAMKDAQYADNTAKNPKNLTDSLGFKELTKPIIEQLEKKRQEAIDAMTGKKIKAEKAKDLTDIIDKLTKNIQLLGGKATENIKQEVELNDNQLRQLIREREKSSNSKEAIK